MSLGTVTEPTAPAPQEARSAAASSARRSTSERGRTIALQIGLPTLVGVALLVSWQLLTARELVSPLLLPAPADVWSALDAGIIEGLWWQDIKVTLLEMLIGFGIGVASGLLLGALFAYSRLSRIAFYPYVIALQSFPKIAVAPLLVVALGYGMSPKIAVAASLAYFPVMTAAIAGFTEIDEDEHNFMRSINASKWQEMRFLRLPNAMSYLFPSLDVALIVALLGAVAAELVGSNAGLGNILMERQAFGDTPAIFAALIVLAVIGVVLQTLVVLLRRVLPRSIVPR